ncbi:MAG: Lacal_2735 family protein [Bacteroidetes bacterium]|nr:Lacal_2735 family protein [Bacteroidota bacterium]
MFGLFKKANPKDKLEKKYRDLMEQAHKYSTTNRKLSDQKVQEAEEVMQELERLAKH